MTGRVEAMDGGVEMAEGREGGGYEKMGIEKTKHLQGKQLFRVSFGAEPLPSSRMGAAWSPFCLLWPLLPLRFLPF